MTVIVHNNTGAQLHGADERAVAIVSDLLSYDLEGAQYTAGVKLGMWNGKRTFLRYPNFVFEAGFVPMVRRALAENGYPVSLIDRRTEVLPLGPALPPARKGEDGFDYYDGYLDGISLYDFQAEAVETLVRERRGIVHIATGGGKTETAIAMTKRIARKTLFLTHKLDLVNQTRRRFQARLGVVPGMISEGEWMPSEITVATVQTVYSQLKREPDKVLAYLRSIEFLIVDEAHRSSSDTFFMVISACENAYFRASLTATPLMKGRREDDLKLIASSGVVICRITNRELIDRGILAQPAFTFVEVPHFGWKDSEAKKLLGSKPAPGALYQLAYTRGIVENERRNRMVVNETRKLVEAGRKTVVLVQREKHGEILQEMMQAAGIRSQWVYGKDDATLREQSLVALRNGDIDVLIASTILDEGLDCDAISGIVLAGGGKSKISLFQRVGRSVRKKKGEELEKLGNTARIIDFVDTGQKNLIKHSALRYKAVRDEEGWILDRLVMWNEYQKDFEGGAPPLMIH